MLLCANADHAVAGHGKVIVYSGPPENGQVVAVTRMLGVFDNGMSTASFQYVPETDGVHEVHAVILGGGGILVRRGNLGRD